MQKSIRPKKKTDIQHGVWTTDTFGPRQNPLVIHAGTDNAQKDTSESIGNSCQNSHKRKKGGGENDDMEKK